MTPRLCYQKTALEILHMGMNKFLSLNIPPVKITPNPNSPSYKDKCYLYDRKIIQAIADDQRILSLKSRINAIVEQKKKIKEQVCNIEFSGSQAVLRIEYKRLSKEKETAENELLEVYDNIYDFHASQIYPNYKPTSVAKSDTIVKQEKETNRYPEAIQLSNEEICTQYAEIDSKINMARRLEEEAVSQLEELRKICKHEEVECKDQYFVTCKFCGDILNHEQVSKHAKKSLI